MADKTAPLSRKHRQRSGIATRITRISAASVSAKSIAPLLSGNAWLPPASRAAINIAFALRHDMDDVLCWDLGHLALLFAEYNSG